MAFRIFARMPRRQLLLASGSLAGGAGLAGSQLGAGDDNQPMSAQDQFYTSFGYAPKGTQTIKPPPGWTGRLFKIRVDYPKASEEVSTQGLPPIPGPDRPVPSATDAPWLKVDFRKAPQRYCDVIKEYCYEGNLNPQKEFVLQENHFRDWYHAPWMHWNANGREPLNGLTFERPTPALEFAKAQTQPLQTWACGFYNRAGKHGSSTFPCGLLRVV